MDSSKSIGQGNPSHQDAGYALPSVLFLILLLSTIAFSVLQLALVDRKLALRQVHEIQAEFAAQNGVHSTIIDLNRSRQWLQDPIVTSSQYEYPDGSSASVRIRPWGAFVLVESRGESHQKGAYRGSILAAEPGQVYSNAFVLGNAEHSLVMTGSSTIAGNVMVGKAGVSTGALQNFRTPNRIPISGKVTVSEKPPMPVSDRHLLRAQVEQFEALLEGAGSAIVDASHQTSLAIWREPTLNADGISDSIELIRCQQGVRIIGKFEHRKSPLYVVIHGPVLIEATLTGPVAILSSDSISVDSSAHLLHTLLYSRNRINVNQTISIAQLFAPQITVGSGSQLLYPSIAASVQARTHDPGPQSILLEPGSRLEGSVILMNDQPAEPTEALIDLKGGARVVGSVFSNAFITLDGEVDGTVLTHDLYFHEPPTTYLGWLRTGRVNRSALPDGFLVPTGTSEEERVEVLAWM